MLHSYQHPIEMVAAPCEPVFKLFIACEDNAAFFQARKVEDQVKVLCGEEIKTSRVFWSFSLLRHPRLRQHAVREAAEAQLIIVSVTSNQHLPSSVKALIESLPACSYRGQAALVALVGHEEGPLQEPPPNVPYLRRVADQRGLDFFCNKSGWDRLDFGSTTFPVPPRPVVMPENTVSYRIPWSAGGINE
jgi:hypothetical protein